MNVTIERTDERAQIPHGNFNSAGFDLHSVDEGTIASNTVGIIGTGIRLGMPLDADFYGQIMSRSGLASKGIIAIGGVIDRDYRGEIKVLLLNTSPLPFAYRVRDRIAQLVFLRQPEIVFVEQQVDDQTARGFRGFGSTGM
jgi:dUTP pyrophosphatase